MDLFATRAKEATLCVNNDETLSAR
jgi:hypothetical protein